MTAKFYDTHFDEYITSYKNNNLHPKLLHSVFSNLPKIITELPNMIFYGPKGIGKYTQVLSVLQNYSPSNLKYEKKLLVNFTNNKSQNFYKLSDIHVEIDMSLLGCNAKLLWNEIHNQLIDIACIKENQIFIVMCKNFQEIHSELLDNFYSYMQTTPYIKTKLVYMIISDQISFIPDNIINICKIIPISRPNKTLYSKCIGTKLITDININNITNIKNVSSKITELMNPHEITCNKIITLINDYHNMSFAILRDYCYDIFIYHLDIYECVWYILHNLIANNVLDKQTIYPVLIKTFQFFKYYNNNYRPIYHLENYILYLISNINDIK